MKFAKRVFLVAGIYGLIVVLPQYLLEKKTGDDYPPPITHPEFYYGFVGVTVAFQIVFLIIARDPARYRPIMIAAILEKASFVIAVFILYANHRVPYPMLLFASIDAFLGMLFIAVYLTTPSQADS
jgi:hypothetical protein